MRLNRIREYQAMRKSLLMITTAAQLMAVTALCCMAADPMAPIDPAAYKAPVRVACIGDSITEGAGAYKGKSWPEQLQGLLGKSWQVMNFGLGGRTLLKQGDINESWVIELIKRIDALAAEMKLGVKFSIWAHWGPQCQPEAGDWYARQIYEEGSKYDYSLYDKDLYKSAKSVIQMLADIVSKNGNLLLSIPLRGDGLIDDKEEMILAGIASWMDVNKEAIFGTRPWKMFGEGPAATAAPPPKDGEAKPFTAADVRFTTKGKTPYTMLLDNPGTREVLIPALTTAAGQKITAVSRLGYAGKLEWLQGATGLRVTMSKPQPTDHVVVLKVL